MCSVCGSRRHGLQCGSCAAGALAGARAELRRAEGERAALAARVRAPLERDAARRRRRLDEQEAADDAEAARCRAAAARRRAETVQREACAAAAAAAARAAALDAATRQLDLFRDQALRDLERGTQCRAVVLACALEDVAAERTSGFARRLACLLPLELLRPVGAGGGGGDGGPATGPAVLGHLVLLMDVLGRYLGLPLLHRAGVRGGHTVVWRPSGFWEKRVTPPNEALPLSAAAGGGAPGGDPPAQQLARRRADAAAAEALLARSAAALVSAHLGPEAPRRARSPTDAFVWLAHLPSLLQAPDPRGGGGTPASSVRWPGGCTPLHVSVLGHSLLLSSLAGVPEPPPPSGGSSEDGWEVMPAAGGLLPPPPGDEDDVEHWQQAHAVHGQGGTAPPRGAAEGALAALVGHVSSSLESLGSLARRAAVYAGRPVA